MAVSFIASSIGPLDPHDLFYGLLTIAGTPAADWIGLNESAKDGTRFKWG